MGFGASIVFGPISAIIAAAFVGDVVTEGAFSNRICSAINAAGQATQVSTLTVDTATASATYTFVLNGVTITFVNGVSTDTTVVAGLIKDQLIADGYAGSVANITQATNVITFTAKGPGTAYSFTLTDSDAKLTSATGTAAAAASAVAFGVVVIETGYSDTGGVVNRKAAIPLTSYFTAQVDTITVVYAASEEYTAYITINGITYATTVIANTDSATTATDLATAINAKMPADTVIAAATSGGALTLTAEVPGTPFVTGTGVLTTDSRMSVAKTTATPQTDIDRVLLGVTIRDPSIPYTTLDGTTASYPANTVMDILQFGDIAVTSAQTISPGEAVYVETASGASCGLCYNTSSATRIRSNKLVWARDLTNDSAKAVLRVAA